MLKIIKNKALCQYDTLGYYYDWFRFCRAL